MFSSSGLAGSLTLCIDFSKWVRAKESKSVGKWNVMLTRPSLLKKARQIERVPFSLQICLLQLQWRSLRSHCLALHLHRILPQDWALFPSTTIPEYPESRTVVRSLKQRGKAFLLFTHQTLKGGGEVYCRCYGDYILSTQKGGLLMDKIFFLSSLWENT